MDKSFSSTSSGQTMIEIVVALSIAIVVLGALVVAIISGLRNAKFAQNQAIATKYGQDTIEELRAIRDRNLTVNNCAGSTCLFSAYLASPPPPSCGGSCSYYYFRLIDSSLALTDHANNQVSDDLGNGFSRIIIMCPSISSDPSNPCSYPNGIPTPTSHPVLSSNEKYFTVQITWSDISGLHVSNLQTVLSEQ